MSPRRWTMMCLLQLSSTRSKHGPRIALADFTQLTTSMSLVSLTEQFLVPLENFFQQQNNTLNALVNDTNDISNMDIQRNDIF